MLFFLIAFGLCLSQPKAISIDLSDVRLDADNTGLIIKTPDEVHFIKADNLVPGDSFTKTLIIENTNYTNPYTLTFYSKDPISIPPDLDFMNKIEMTIRLDGEEIYRGKAAGKDDDQGRNIEVKVPLGTISPNTSRRLEVDINLPGEILTNAYSSASGKSTWVLEAISTDPILPEPEDPIKSGKQVKTGVLTKDNLLTIFTGFLLFSVGLLHYLEKKKKSKEK